MSVPFLDLKAAYLELQPEIDAAVARVLVAVTTSSAPKWMPSRPTTPPTAVPPTALGWLNSQTMASMGVVQFCVLAATRLSCKSDYAVTRKRRMRWKRCGALFLSNSAGYYE